MTVRHEIKSQLAKLLATEDLVVEHKKVETAQFNVHTRVLTLPMWEKASNTVYDLLVGHEVGHALYTPDEDWTVNVKVPPQFVNIVEDARIEKMMKRRYPGLAKTFFNGYKELADDDFFQIGDDKLETYNLADRANLLFKIGNYTDIPIECGEETEIVNLIGDSETFADVLIASDTIICIIVSLLMDSGNAEMIPFSSPAFNMNFINSLSIDELSNLNSGQFLCCQLYIMSRLGYFIGSNIRII